MVSKHITMTAAVILLALAGTVSAETVYVEPGGDIQGAVNSMHQLVPASHWEDWNEVIVAPGTFELSSGLTILPGVRLMGSGPGSTILLVSGASGVRMREFSMISGFTIQVSDLVGITANRAYDGPNIIMKCNIEKTGTISGAGIDIVGGQVQTSWIADCYIGHFWTGISATDSGVNIARCQFYGTGGDAVRVQSSATKQLTATVPLLGRADDLENTALNQFRMIGGQCLRNQTSAQVQAEMNDWGVYEESAIQAKISGPADSGPFLGKSIGPGTLVANVVDGSSSPIPVTANPTCTIPAAGLTGQRDPVSERFVFNGVPEGAWSVQASAVGYGATSKTVTVSSLNITPVTLNLSSGGGGCGAKNARAAYACCALLLWGAGYRRRRRGEGAPPAD